MWLLYFADGLLWRIKSARQDIRDSLSEVQAALSRKRRKREEERALAKERKKKQDDMRVGSGLKEFRRRQPNGTSADAEKGNTQGNFEK